MQSNNGDLYFRAGIDLDGFNADASAMERRMKDVTSNVVQDAGQMDDAISKIGSAFTKIVGVGAAGGFVKEMFNVRSEMQNTEAMLRVFLGSAEKADKFFRSLQGYAYYNVFEFKDLAKQSAQLLAYRTNVEEVIPTLNKLSEIAAGTNTPLEELVTVFNKVKATNKLNSDAIYSLGNKGIDVRQAIAEIRELETGQKMLAEQVDVTGLKFKDLQKIIDHVATNGGMFEGMMEEKMKTLGDTWGLMQDNLTNMFNEIGAANQDLLKGGMDVANFLIENYQSIAKVLGTLVVAYGTAQAAQIAFNIAQKNGTGIAVLDNTVWAIRGSLLRANIENGENITASIRKIKAAQEEEITTLKAAITEQEHEEVLRKSRIANLDDILSQTQKAKLAQMGLNSASEEYLPIAVSMLDKEQRMQLAKAELTRNNQSYIEALRGVVGMHGDEINTLDERIELATSELAMAEKAADAAIDEREQLEKKVAIYKDYYEASLNNVNATDLQERTEALETAQSQLEAAAKNAEAAAETRNTAQKKLNELQTKRNAIAESTDTAATNANRTAKNLLTLAVAKLRTGLKALWAVMAANPVGAIVTAVTSLYAIVSHFVNKNKEAKEAQEEENREMAEFHKEVNTATDRLNTLRTALSTATTGSSAYNQALKQVNDMCKEYNVELINTNDNLQTQKEKYDNLKTAIEGVTAAKLREQFTTTAIQSQSDRNSETMAKFRSNIQNKHLFKEGFRDVWNDETKFGTMWNLMLNKAQWAAEGDDSTYIAAVDDLLKAMQKISGYSIDRNGDAASYLRTAFRGLVDSAKEAQRDINRANDALSVYEQTMNAHKSTTKETTTSVSDLNKQLKEQKDIITDLEKKARNGGLTADEESALTQARARVTELEKRKKNLTGQTASSAKKEHDERKKAIEQMTADELDLENQRQEALISLMADGTEKRQAILQLEYQKQLQAIKKAEEEYIKHRKEAGQSETIDPNSKAGKSFQYQRLAAEQSFLDKSRKLFDTEVEYRRAEYERYNKWVTDVSREAAELEFRDLLTTGQSFNEWLNNEISRLEDKKASSGLDVGEGEYLSNLYNEKKRNEEESYKHMEEQMNKDIEAASTLAEKLEIINKWIEKIKNNGGRGSARANLLLNASQQRTETIEEATRQFDERYQLFNKKRTQLERQYLEDISKLNAQHRTEEAEAVRREMENILQETDTDFLKGLVATVFKNPSKKNIREALATLRTIQDMTLDQFNSQFGNDQFKLTQDQLDAIKGSIGDVNTAIKKLGEGYTLADAFKEIRDGRIDGDMEKVARGTEFMQNAFSKFASVVSTLSAALNDLADATNNTALKNTAKTVSSISSVIGTAGSWAGTGASIGGGWGALIGGVLGGGIGIVTEILKSNQEELEKIAANGETGLAYQQNVADQLTSIMSAVQSLSDTVTSLNYEQYRSTLLSLIEDLKESEKQWSSKNADGESYWQSVYHAVLASDSNYNNNWGYGSEWTDNMAGNIQGIWKKLVDAGLMSEEEALNRYRQASRNSSYEYWGDAMWRGWDNLWYGEGGHEGRFYIDEDEYKEETAKSIANYINWLAGQFAAQQKRLIEELRDLYASNSFDSLEYFNKENEVYQSQLEYLQFQKEWLEVLGEDTTEIERQIAEMEHTMSESLQHMAEGLYGTDIGSIINEWISIFQEFGDNVEGAFNAIDKSVDNMIANMLRQRLVIEPLMNELTQIFADYQQEVGEDHQYTNEDFIEIANRIRNARADAYEGYQDYLNFLDSLGINLADITNTDTLTGSLQNLSEETGGVIAGRLNAMVINQAEGNNFLRQQLMVQYEMRNYLGSIQSDVATIRQYVNNTIATPRFNGNMNYGYSEI